MFTFMYLYVINYLYKKIKKINKLADTQGK